MNDELREMAQALLDISTELRKLADAAGRGPVGLTLNALATQVMLSALAVKGAAEVIRG